jgi:hypothetical protein
MTIKHYASVLYSNSIGCFNKNFIKSVLAQIMFFPYVAAYDIL